MIVPRNRLLFWVGVGVVPFATAATLVPSLLMPVGAVLALFALLVTLDATLGFGSLDGIGVEPPEVVRLTKDREGLIEFLISNTTQKPMVLRLGLAFPQEIQSPQTDLLTQLPAGSAGARVTWPCTGTRRGAYRLERCYVEGASPMGFWSVRAATPMESELRVYPNLLPERKNLAALFLHRGNLGSHAQRQVGQGRDFEKLRDYIHGDPLTEIHWKATAKRNRPVTKIFQIEKTQEVYVIIDSSRLSARSSRPGESVLERFVTAALVVGLAAEQQGDLFGVLSFGDKVQTFVRAKNGREHFTACRDALYGLLPQTVTPDFDNLCTFIRLRLRRRALLLVLTSLDDPMLAESFTRHVNLISRQHLVLVNMLQPAGAAPLFAGEPVESVDGLYQRLGGHIRWHDLRELERVLQRRNVKFSQLQDERLSVDLVGQYLNVKRRQIL